MSAKIDLLDVSSRIEDCQPGFEISLSKSRLILSRSGRQGSIRVGSGWDDARLLEKVIEGKSTISFCKYTMDEVVINGLCQDQEPSMMKHRGNLQKIS